MHPHKGIYISATTSPVWKDGHVYHVTGSTRVANLHTVVYCTAGCLASSSLQVSTHIAYHSKALLKFNLNSILPLLYPYVAEMVDDGEEEFLHVQAKIAGSTGKVCKAGRPFCRDDNLLLSWSLGAIMQHIYCVVCQNRGQPRIWGYRFALHHMTYTTHN